MTRHIYKYRVFLDSNAMRDMDWVKADFFERLDALREEQLADVDFYLPEIIKQEWVKHFHAVATANQNKLSAATRTLGAMGLSNISHAPLTRDEIKAQAELILEVNKLKMINTPYETVDWSDLMRRAVENVPPFEKTNDKGIKDGVFAQTIKDYYKRHSSKRNMRFAVITHDGPLKEYMKEICPSPRVVVHDSLEDFKSVLKLNIAEQKSDLLTKAKTAFYTSGDNNSLYWIAKLPAKMTEQYKALVSSSARNHIIGLSADQIISEEQIPRDEIWTPLDKSFVIKQTTFTGRSGGRFRWMTFLSYTQAYGLASIGGENESPINNTAAVMHTAMFIINWSCRLDNTGNIEKSKVDKIEIGDEFATTDLYPGIDRINGTTRLTKPISPPSTGSGLHEALAQLTFTPLPPGYPFIKVPGSGIELPSFPKPIQLPPGLQDVLTKVTDIPPPGDSLRKLLGLKLPTANRINPLDDTKKK